MTTDRTISRAGATGATLAAFVLGMHRSGTSAVARLINLLGVPINLRADWMPDTPQNNPTGFWESLSLSRMNDEVLAALDGTWQIPPTLERGWPADPRLDTLRAAAPGAVAEVFPTKHWVWKDPRNCLTLPFWLDVLDVTPALVLVHRSPVEVALSLLRREALPISHSLVLGERYLRTSIAAATGRPTYVLDYGRLVEDPVGSTDELGRFLTALGFEVVQPDAAAVQSFVSPELRHSRFPDPDTWPQFGVSPEQIALHAALASATGPHDAFAVSDPGPETLGTEVRLRRLRAERNAAHTLESTSALLHEAREAIVGLQAAQAELGSRLESLAASVAAHDARHATEVAALATEASALATEVATLREQAVTLRLRLDAVERSKAFRLLTAPGRLRRRIGTREAH